MKWRPRKVRHRGGGEQEGEEEEEEEEENEGERSGRGRGRRRKVSPLPKMSTTFPSKSAGLVETLSYPCEPQTIT